MCKVVSGEHVEPFVAATTHPIHALRGCMAIASLVPLHNIPFKAKRQATGKLLYILILGNILTYKDYVY